MKTVCTMVLILCTLISCGQQNTSNTNTQTVSWGGKAAVGGYAPEGTLTLKNITASFDGNLLNELRVVIDMKSLDQENKQLTKHLKEKDFFHVKKYPEAVFELTTPFDSNKDKVLVGNMTIKNKTQREEILVVASLEGDVLVLQFEHDMNRLDYGITYNSPSVFEKLKENAIADTIMLKGMLRIQ